MKLDIQTLSANQQEYIDDVENKSDYIDNTVNDIIKPYCKDLDSYVEFISTCLRDGERPPTTHELEDFCMNLSTLIYFTAGTCEHLGIRDDMSKAIWKDAYNSVRDSIEKGTVADKNAAAELETQHEQLTNICYNRSYKILKSKVDSAQELLASCKKVLSHRMQEEELTRIGG